MSHFSQAFLLSNLALLTFTSSVGAQDAEARLVRAVAVEAKKKDIAVKEEKKPAGKKSVTAEKKLRGVQVHLENGDRLTGFLHSLNDKELKLTYEGKRVVTFSSDKIKSCQVHSSLQSFGSASHVVLKDGSVLPGTIVAVMPKTIILSSPIYLGQLHIKRSEIKNLYVSANDSAVYRGFPSRNDFLSSWSGVKGWEWKAKTKSLVSKGSEALKLKKKTPSSFHMRLEFSSPTGNSRDFNLVLGIKGKGNAMLQLDFNRSWMSAYLNDVNGSSSNRSFNSSTNTTKSSVLEVYFNADKKQTLIYLNTKKLGEFNSDYLNGKGGELVFTSNGNNKVSLDSLLVREWDGNLLKKEEVASAKEYDIIELINGDALNCELQGFKGGNLLCLFEGEDLEVPLANVRRCVLRKQATEVAEDIKGMSFSGLHILGELNFFLQGADKDFLSIGHSAFARPLKMRINAFESFGFKETKKEKTK